MAQAYTKIRIKRTTKSFSDSSVKNIIPDFGEWVYSHTANLDELVVGDGEHTIEFLPRLNLSYLNDINNNLNIEDLSLIDMSAVKDTFPTSGATVGNKALKYAASDSTAGAATYSKITKTNSNNTCYLNYVTGTGSQTVRTTDKLTLTLSSAGSTLVVGDGSNTGKISLSDGSSNTVVIEPPAVSSNVVLTLPSTSGTLINSNSIKTAPVTTVSTSAPSNAVNGQLYINPNTSVLYYYNSGSWKPVVGVWG